MGCFVALGRDLERVWLKQVIGDRLIMVDSSVEGESSDGRFPSHVYKVNRERNESRGF